MKKTRKEILVCQGDDDLQMKVKTDGETVWLTQEQMCQLWLLLIRGSRAIVVVVLLMRMWRG